MLTARDGDLCGAEVFLSRSYGWSGRRAQDRFQEVRRRRAEVKERLAGAAERKRDLG